MSSSMGGKNLPGSHLLAALHAGMERMKTCLKVSRAASKKPQNRTNLDINHIVSETKAVQLLTEQGQGVHRDLCHVVQHMGLGQMASLRLPGDHVHGLFVYVMQGKLQVRTRSQYKAALSADSSSSGGSGSGSGSGNSTGIKTVTISTAQNCTADNEACPSERSNGFGKDFEAELRALFDSIDVDGSGAIDVEELQYALEVMGIQKSAAEVQELMDSVDKDGSGELEFSEFVTILTTKLGVGSQQSTWQELGGDCWALEVGQGGCLGASALRQGLHQDGLLVALEDSDLLLLGGDVYKSILATGFDGQLTSKMNFLKTCPALYSSLSGKSDLRGLAYVATAESYGWGSRVYSARQSCAHGSLYIIQDGSCRITGKVKAGSEAPRRTSTAGVMLGHSSQGQAVQGTDSNGDPQDGRYTADVAPAPRHAPHSPRSRLPEQSVELAVVGPGDIIGEAALLGCSVYPNTAVVASADLAVLKLQVSDMQLLMHAADLKALQNILTVRDAERSQRLAAAAVTASALQAQQQHIRSMAAAAAAAINSCNNQSCGSEAAGFDGQGGGAQALGRTAESVSVSASGGATARNSVSGSGGATVRGSVSVGGEAALRTLLPSSGASAAAAIAASASAGAAGSLPSRVARAQSAAVTQLLTDLVGAKEDMLAAREAVIASTAAALAAGVSSGSGSSSDWSSAQVLSSTPPGRKSFAASGTNTGSAGRAPYSMPGAVGHQERSLAAADSTVRAAGQLSASSPGAATVNLLGRQSQLQEHDALQSFAAARVLLPDRLVAKLQRAINGQQMGHSRQQRQQQQLLQQTVFPPAGPAHGRANALMGTPRSREATGSTCGLTKRRSSSMGGHSKPTCMEATASATVGSNATDAGLASQHHVGYSPTTISSNKNIFGCEHASRELSSDSQGAHAVSHDAHAGCYTSRVSSGGHLFSPPQRESGITQCTLEVTVRESMQQDTFFLQTDSACGAAEKSQLALLAGCTPPSDLQPYSGKHAPSGVLLPPAVQQQGHQQEPDQHSKQQEGTQEHDEHAQAGGTQGESPSTSEQPAGVTTSELLTDPNVSFLPTAPSLPVLTLQAVAAAQQQLASGNINLPSPRRSRRNHGVNLAAGAAVVSLEVPAEVATAASRLSARGQGEPGCAVCPAVSPRLSFRAGKVEVQGSSRASIYRASCSTACVGSAIGAAPSGGSSWGCKAVSPAVTAAAAEAALGDKLAARASLRRSADIGAGCGSDSVWCQRDEATSTWPRAAAAPATAPAGTQGFMHRCSVAKPVAGGVFVEVDGPAWDAAEHAADVASWCLTSRTSRFTTSSRTQQQPGLALLQAAPLSPEPPVKEGKTAGNSAEHNSNTLAATADVIAAAQDLLGKQLPAGVLGDGCRPAGAARTVLHLSRHGGALGSMKSRSHSGVSTHASSDMQGTSWSACTGVCQPGAIAPASNWPAAAVAVKGNDQRSLQRPAGVPKLRLAKLQLSLDAADACHSPVSAGVGTGNTSPSKASVRCSGLQTGRAGAADPHTMQGGLLHLQQPQQQVSVPPVLPAFTPRRMWAPGGSQHSDSGSLRLVAHMTPL